MKIYIVIPVYNEAEVLARVIRDVRKSIPNIIVVNDASIDNSKSILKKLPVITLNNRKNQGYAKALEKGIVYAFKLGADYVITFDADGQHKTSNFKKVIDVLKKNEYELFVGKRRRYNRFMERVFGLYAKIKYGFSDPLCGFKVYKRSLFQRYNFLETSYTIATEFTFRAIRDGAKFKEIDIETQDRVGSARFGGRIKGNLLELKAFLNIVRKY